MDLMSLLGLFSNFVAAVSAFAAMRAARFAAHQVHLQQSAGKAEILLELAHEWTRIYPLRNEVLRMNLDLDKIKREYPDATKFLITPEWKQIREVANFYNYCGVLIHENYIEPELLFTMVTLDSKIYDSVEPLILWLRETHRQDLYDFFLAMRHRVKDGAVARAKRARGPI